MHEQVLNEPCITVSSEYILDLFDSFGFVKSTIILHHTPIT